MSERRHDEWTKQQVERMEQELNPMHPATAQVWQYFAYAHLSPELQEISKPFCDLAYEMVRKLPESPEVTVGLRKLLEAKDCMVRARLYGAE